MCDIRPIEVGVPLRIVIPHRVWHVLDDSGNRLQIERETFRQKNEVRSKPLGASANPALSQASSDETLGATVVDEERLVTRALECALDRGLHPPRVFAADHQNAQLPLVQLAI